MARFGRRNAPTRPRSPRSAAALAVPAAAGAPKGSLYSGPGPEAGPEDPLREAEDGAAAEEQGRSGAAKPILISGASAYRKGEFLYQDYLYDDIGAKGQFDPADPKADRHVRPLQRHLQLSARRAYAQNAADLVELRVKPLRDATAFRLTYNSMTDPELVATTIAIGDSAEPQPFPHGANVVAPAELFLTVHGTPPSSSTPRPARRWRRRRRSRSRPGAARSRFASRAPPGTRAPSKVRLAAGSGLWDAAAGRYLIPAGAADADTPGGAARRPTRRRSSTSPSASTSRSRTSPTCPRSSPTRAGGATTTRRTRSPPATSRRSPRPSTSRSCGRGKRDDLHGRVGGVPTSGPMNRILSSRFAFGQGADWARGVRGLRRLPEPAPRPPAAVLDLRPGEARSRGAATGSPCCCTRWAPTTTSSPTPTTSRRSASAGRARS